MRNTVCCLFSLCTVLLTFGCSKSSESEIADELSVPPVFKTRFETSKGNFVIEVTREWSPQGAARFFELVKTGYFNGNRFFRVVPGFVVQWGLSSDPAETIRWRSRFIPDDPVRQTNARGYVSFAKSQQPNSRAMQVCINLVDNAKLDTLGFAPFGRVTAGMDVVDSLYSGYGETPRQELITAQGNAYLLREFPQLDYIRQVVMEP